MTKSYISGPNPFTKREDKGPFPRATALARILLESFLEPIFLTVLLIHLHFVCNFESLSSLLFGKGFCDGLNGTCSPFFLPSQGHY